MSKYDFLHLFELAIISFLLIQLVYPIGLTKRDDTVDQDSLSNLPEPQIKITKTEDALVDLRSLGCTMVNITEMSQSSSESGFLLEYNEFRKVAFETKMVFLKWGTYYDSQKKTNRPFALLMTIYDGKYFVSTAEDMKMLS